jgi:hypothetical protein
VAVVAVATTLMELPEVMVAVVEVVIALLLQLLLLREL